MTSENYSEIVPLVEKDLMAELGINLDELQKKNEGQSEVNFKTIRQYLLVLVGRIKIAYQDLFVLSRSEIDSLIEGHELDIRDTFSLHRELTGVIIQPWLKKGASVKMNKILVFPWEKKPKTEVNTQSIEKAKKLGEIVRQKRIKPRDNGKS
jgi:hypothetical protein